MNDPTNDDGLTPQQKQHNKMGNPPPKEEDPILKFVQDINENFLRIQESIKRLTVYQSALIAFLINKGTIKKEELVELEKLNVSLLAQADQKEMEKKEASRNGTTERKRH